MIKHVDIDIHCGDETVERITLKEGDTFAAEVYCSDYEIEVVGIGGVEDT